MGGGEALGGMLGELYMPCEEWFYPDNSALQDFEKRDGMEVAF